jgi:rhodanese-related sulfurtransferase
MKKPLIILFSIMLISFIACKPSIDSSVASTIDVTQLAKLKVDEPGLIFLDVRTPKEVSNGKITSDALEIDFFNDNFTAEVIKLDKTKPYLVYCKSGGRSSKAIDIMHKNGFTNLTNLDGGYSAWSKQ